MFVQYLTICRLPPPNDDSTNPPTSNFYFLQYFKKFNQLISSISLINFE
jgi:hypothetical protein